MRRNNQLCSKCDRLISKSNFSRHVNSCKGKRIPKVRGIDFDPNRGYLNKGRTAWNKGLTKETNNSIAKASKILKNKWETGEIDLSYLDRPEYRKSLSDAAKRNNSGGYKENAGRSKKYKVHDSFGKLVTLQSSYELRLSNILNNLKIKWIRPIFLKYDDRKYFPDFYLIDYDLYLDPKNDFLITKDTEKIQKVIQQNNVNLLILNNKQINEEYINHVCLNG